VKQWLNPSVQTVGSSMTFTFQKLVYRRL